jgi:phosphate transport system substrate-binding protein
MLFPVIAILLLFACSRRPTDEAIANQIKAKYFSDPTVKLAVLSVNVKEGKVTLSGNVPDADVHLRAVQLAFATAGVTAIDDKIAVVRREPSPQPAPILTAAHAAAPPPFQPDPGPEEPSAAAETPAVQLEPPPPPVSRPPALRIRRAPVQVHVTSLAQPAIAAPADPPPPDAVDSAQPAMVLVESPAPAGAYRAPRHLARAITLEATGSALGEDVYNRWFAGFTQWQPNVTVHSEPRGLGYAVKLMPDHAIDLAYADRPLTDGEEAALSGPLHVPVLLDAVIVTYNLPGVNQPVNFTSQALAGIYLGTITRWDDPMLAAANPNVTLPAAEIVTVHRSDSSGTNFAWTDYLSQVSPEWRTRVGAASAVAWPVVGLGGSQDAGVAGLVRQTPNSIGYLNMAFAIQNHIAMGRIRNAAGDLVSPSPATISAAAISPSKPSSDGRVDIVNSPAHKAYPITRYHWFILPPGQPDRIKKDAVVDMVQWTLTAGQGVELYGYVPLPQSIAASALRELHRQY